MSGPLQWSHNISEINEGGLKKRREANSQEQKQLMRSLDLLDCESLVVNYSIHPLSTGWRLQGDLSAIVAQPCVISLEPVVNHIIETFDVEFRNALPKKKITQDDDDVLVAEDIEFFEDDKIDVGSIVYETLSTALNPYPRKEGAEFVWQDPQIQSDMANVSPFSVLKKLKSDS